MFPPDTLVRPISETESFWGGGSDWFNNDQVIAFTFRFSRVEEKLIGETVVVCVAREEGTWLRNFLYLPTHTNYFFFFFASVAAAPRLGHVRTIALKIRY